MVLIGVATVLASKLYERLRPAPDPHPALKHFEILGDIAAMPCKAWWPQLDEILALPETHDCSPLEWLAEEGA